jgi:hypothetical protein
MRAARKNNWLKLKTKERRCIRFKIRSRKAEEARTYSDFWSSAERTLQLQYRNLGDYLITEAESLIQITV